MKRSLEERLSTSPLYAANAPYIEEYYERYLADPASVDASWRRWFDSFPGDSDGKERPHGPLLAALERRLARPAGAAGAAAPADHDDLAAQAAVSRLIAAYRLHGHRLASLDPLGLRHHVGIADLEPDYHGLTDTHLEMDFYTESLAGTERLPLREIISVLRSVYSGTIGAEFAHLSSTRQRMWLRQRFEGAALRESLSPEVRRRVLQQLTAAEGIERYLHTRYVGQKRFSLEGGESLIPLLDDVTRHAGANGIREIVIGMAHRGRLNVLVNALGKSPAELFSEFEGDFKVTADRGSGDVKYHLGFSADFETAGGKVHIALAFNPSHLEIVNPVVEGSVRARQDRRGDTRGAEVLPVLIHGDAAFAGQGVVMETLQMSGTRAYTTGGTLHVICNNQIGFTTSDPRDARSTPYASDVAKMLEAPVLHVNGDDPEAVLLATRVALDYRRAFGQDVVVDLVCYRRHGHNEADEPAVTQPQMYETIRGHTGVRTLYANRLVEDGVVTEAEVDEWAEEYRRGLEAGEVRWMHSLGNIGNEYTVDWSRYHGGDWTERVDTWLPAERVASLGGAMTRVPGEFKLHPRVARIVADRQKMAAGALPLDWGFAEMLAYASLLSEGYGVRITGQDVGRGTFFHRHAVMHEQTDGSRYVPLEHLAEQPDIDGQGRFQIYDSLLSEEAVLGFEYGYSTAEPNTLVIWEAQFGDFFNGAQVVVDQFISSGESKWGRLCGMVLYLPHGYEGQGPEHSSARLERFLQLCAEHNIQVCVPSTPAQMFHMLRRQMMRGLRKPLVVMTPKSLLRHKLAVSTMDELTRGGFRNVIGETDAIDPASVARVVFCSGKVYYDLLQARRDGGRTDVALVRIEQLYPFPVQEYAAQIARYASAREIVWCQEEPQNQGAWYQIRHRLQEPLKPVHDLFYAGREASAAPAAGYYRLHTQQQRQLVADALGTAEDTSVAVNK